MVRPDPSPALPRLLAAVLETPTAPCREERLIELVLEFARSRGLTAARDPYGNVAVVRDGQGARVEGPPLALLAALDHPGGEVVAVAGDAAEIAWHGEVPVSCLQDVRVRVHGRQGATPARVTSCTARPGQAGDVADRLLVQLGERVQVGDIATVDLPGAWLAGATVHARGAMAPLGAAALLDLLDRLVANSVASYVQCFFTRASALGFAGVQGLVEGGVLLPGQVAVCVHGVAAQPGAVPGGGPVLRLGDGLGQFDAGVVRVLDRAVGRLRENFPEAAIQRAPLVLGSSEAGLLAVQQRPVAALAVPVSAPLNLGARGTLEPETFELSDYQGLVALLEMVCVDWEGPDLPERLRDETRQWLVGPLRPVLRRLGGA